MARAAREQQKYLQCSPNQRLGLAQPVRILEQHRQVLPALWDRLKLRLKAGRSQDWLVCRTTIEYP